jgi:catechol 2,3-dioxygenase
VSTLREAEAFYHSALGLDKVVWSYPGAMFFSAGGYHHHVGTNTWAAGASIATNQDARLLEWELQVPRADDVASVAVNAAQAGYPVASAGADRLITDPSGIAIRVRTKGSQS